jgi:uncharacterized protein
MVAGIPADLTPRRAGADKLTQERQSMKKPTGAAVPEHRGRGLRRLIKSALFLIICLSAATVKAGEPARHVPLSLKPDDVIATGNEWVALPTIRAVDGALMSFNVLSMRDRGLLEVTGGNGNPVLQPYILIDGKPVPFSDPAWELIEYWIPTARVTSNDAVITLTYCAPPGSRAAFVHVTFKNISSRTMQATLGLTASWGGLNRVTYTPVALRGERSLGAAPWVDSAEVFSFLTHDTQFAWSVVHPGAESHVAVPPVAISPSLDARHSVALAAGQTAEANFVLGVGIEEFSAAHSAKALREIIDRDGADAVIARSAAWCQQRTRTTGQPDLDLLMNRNFLFTEVYAWGRTIDTEQLVGVTSRSPRYYVAAAYWDRDAMLWSFPALLDIDKAFAHETLLYALTTQLRNAGVHSRFIDGVALEDGLELDELVAPIIATAEYVESTGDTALLAAHRDALLSIRSRIFDRFDAQTGLYSSLQDAQDEYQKLPFITYDNVLTWRAFLDLAALFDRLHDAADASQMRQKAEALRQAIMTNTVSGAAPGATGTIFSMATDGTHFVFSDVPPGSLLKLPILGFVSEDDPVFVRTYEWLHSRNYQYSYSDQQYGLPGSYRLPFTTSWAVADQLRLARGRQQALRILRTSPWDCGIISEGIDPNSAAMVSGAAFATAAGYVADAICHEFCKKRI